MTELNELDQIIGKACGLLETVCALKSDECASWAYIIVRQLSLPITEGFDPLYVYMMGKIRIVEVKKTKESVLDLKKLIAAGERAIFLVTTIRPLFDVDKEHDGGYAPWEIEYDNYRKGGLSQRVNRILYHMACQKTTI